MNISEETLNKALSILKAGGLVGMPTETVYGLAGDASNPEAVAKIFSVKSRPSTHPLIVHIGDISRLPDWAVDVSSDAFALAENFWPGPLTLILKKASHVSNLLTGDQDSIGLRIPNHPVALQLLQKFKGGIAAPSANKFGRISPTTSTAVYAELGDALELILEGGQCDVGVESTIIDMTGEQPVVLRPGMITTSQIETILNKKVLCKQKNSPRVSGSCESHYAPVTATYVLSAEKIMEEISRDANQVGVISYSLEKINLPHVHCCKLSNNAKHYAHDLYFVMRELDQKKFKKIFIEAVPVEPEWDAVRDRLSRAGIKKN